MWTFDALFSLEGTWLLKRNQLKTCSQAAQTLLNEIVEVLYYKQYFQTYKFCFQSKYYILIFKYLRIRE